MGCFPQWCSPGLVLAFLLSLITLSSSLNRSHIDIMLLNNGDYWSDLCLKRSERDKNRRKGQILDLCSFLVMFYLSVPARRTRPKRRHCEDRPPRREHAATCNSRNIVGWASEGLKGDLCLLQHHNWRRSRLHPCPLIAFFYPAESF